MTRKYAMKVFGVLVIGMAAGYATPPTGMDNAKNGGVDGAGKIPPRSGILVMAHGGDGAWDQDVNAVVEPLRAKYPIEIAFGMARTSTLREAVARLERRGVERIAVVRMFISGESFLPETEYILGRRAEAPAHAPTNGEHDHCMERPEPIPIQASIHLSREGVADSPLVDEILLERAMALSTNPKQEFVLFLAHGPGDDRENERWLERMRQRSRAVGELGGFKEVRCETLREDWPDKRELAEKRIRAFVESVTKEGGRVIVIPFRIAGFGPYEDVLEGLSYVADGRGFCPHPNLTRWIEKTAIGCFDDRLSSAGASRP